MTTPRNLSRLASGANTSGVLSQDKGGTGAATAADAKTALGLHTVATTGSYNDLTNKPVLGDALPSQTGNSGKFLTTDGTNPSWATNPLGTVTSVVGTGTVSGLTLGGTVTTSGNLTLGGTLDLSAYNSVGAFTSLTTTSAIGIAYGGTGQTTATAAFNALVPTQTGNTGKYLTTDGTTTSWATVSGGGGGGSGTSTTRTAFTATAAQTTFTVSYVVGQIDVYMNGSKLLIGTDVTATSGTDIVLASGASAGDIIEAVVYSTQWVTSGSNVYYSTGAVLGGTTSSTGSSPMRFQAKGGSGGTAPYAGYSLISAFDEVSGHFYITSSGENSVMIAADPQNLRASSSIQFAVDGTERIRIGPLGQIGLNGANYGTSGQVLTSQGSGTVPTWTTVVASPGGSNTQVQFNSSGSFSGSANLTFDGTGLTSGRFVPTSSSAPNTGMYLVSANQIGFSSYDGSSVMRLQRYQVGSTGNYRSGATVAGAINTATMPSLFVQGQDGPLNTYSTSTADMSVYSANGNLPYLVGQFTTMSSGYNPSWAVCNIAAAFYASSQGNTVTQFPSGTWQTFPAIGVYSESRGNVGNQQGTAFYGYSIPYYSNATAYYARIENAATSGVGYGYRVDMGTHPFSSGSVGFHSRVVSGQSGSYNNVIGWLHQDDTTSGNTYAAYFIRNGSNVGNIQISTSNTTYSTSSDPRLKNITGPITAEEAKTFIMALQPKKGTWKVDGSDFKGFLSTEYETIDPKAVSGVAGATETLGKIFDADGKMLAENVPQPPSDKLPPGGRWEQTQVKDVYQTLEYGSAAWCANMTAFVQSIQETLNAQAIEIAALKGQLNG